MYTNCKSHLDAGSTRDGFYTITPTADGEALDVWCDMTTDGGGWTIVHAQVTSSAGITGDTALEGNPLAGEAYAMTRVSSPCLPTNPLLDFCSTAQPLVLP